MPYKQLTIEEKRKFVAHMLSQYGVAIDVDNELLPLFYITWRSAAASEYRIQSICFKMEQIGQNTETKTEAIVSDFKKKTDESLRRLEPKQIHFSSAKQAFWHRAAWPTLPLIVLMLLTTSVWYYYENARLEKEHIELVTPFIIGSEVIDVPVSPHVTAQVIKLLEVENLIDAEPGKNFVYDQKCKCVQVPIDYQVRH